MILSALLLAAALRALPFTIDGGDVEQALAADATVCAEAVAAEKESQRLLRNTSITGGLLAVSHLGLDLGTTAWADNRYACRNAEPGQVCVFEGNELVPTTLGRIAAKVAVVTAITGASWLADKLGHRRWAQVLRWLGVAGGVIPAVWNIHRGLTVEKARAAQ